MRETGVVRKELSGEEAAPYIGIARTMLGVVKNQLSFNGLAQGKGTKVFPDGTIIVAQSVFGQDKITITRPVIAPVTLPVEEFVPPTPQLPEYAPVEAPWEESVTAGGLAGCGYYYIVDPAGPGSPSIQQQPYRWTPREGRVLLPLLPGYTAATTSAISGNGRIIVGRASSYGGTPVGTYWDANGVHQLPAGVTGGIGISADGMEFLLGGTFGMARWSASGGLGTPITNHNGGYLPRLSRGGEYISYSVGSFPNTRGTVMNRAGQIFTAPVNSYAKDVSDTGVALIGGVGNNNNYLWDVKRGNITRLPDLSEVRAISSDGRHVVGRDWDSAAIHYTNGVVTVLEPGATLVASSFSQCLDALGSHVLIGGCAALVGDTSNDAPNADDSVWELKTGVYTLTRLPPPPSYLGDGGLMVGITIIREPTLTADGTNHMGVVSTAQQ